jgi:ribosome-binding ATPase YchF (GTP1/OBG family)
MDMEKLETRRERGAHGAELALIDKCLAALEQETPLCSLEFANGELEFARALAPVTLKPTAVTDTTPDVRDAIELMLEATGTVFFYTAGKQEVHAWPVPEGSDIVTCAGRIHSDLARGFIRADVINHSLLLEHHSMNDAKAKGAVQVVDRDYIIQPRDVIEVRFAV